MDLLVIGGGAAGMMCAIQAARNGSDVVLLEKNEKTGKKLYITGKGRCNITNYADLSVFMQNVVRNPKFLYSTLRTFDSATCMRFFEELGLPLKIERGNRVFPVSDKSSDVIKTLNREMQRLGVDVITDESVRDLRTEERRVVSVITDRNEYHPRYVAVCTGGITYPLTGSTGDGYVFAGKLGHTIVEPKPSLCGLILKNALGYREEIAYRLLPKLQGLSLKNIAVKVVDSTTNKTICDEFGEMLFTERGVSGPTILTISSYINRLDYSKLRLIIDIKPGLDEKKLDARILRDFSDAPNKQLKNALDRLLPKSLIPVVIALSGIPDNKEIHSVTKEERERLTSVLKALSFSLSGTEDASSAVVTSGGVDVKEIDPKTMRSKLVSNVFFAGEVLDVDALTGGFNLQIAFATGYVAGTSISESIKKENNL